MSQEEEEKPPEQDKRVEEEDGAQIAKVERTHNTHFCWGECFVCKGFGHKASQCRNKPDSG